MTSITGGGGSDSLSSQNLANSEQILFSLIFFRMRILVLVTCILC